MYPAVVKPILESINAISQQFLISLLEYNQDKNDKKFYKVKILFKKMSVKLKIFLV